MYLHALRLSDCTCKHLLQTSATSMSITCGNKRRKKIICSVRFRFIAFSQVYNHLERNRFVSFLRFTQSSQQSPKQLSCNHVMYAHQKDQICKFLAILNKISVLQSKGAHAQKGRTSLRPKHSSVKQVHCSDSVNARSQKKSPDLHVPDNARQSK